MFRVFPGSQVTSSCLNFQCCNIAAAQPQVERKTLKKKYKNLQVKMCLENLKIKNSKIVQNAKMPNVQAVFQKLLLRLLEDAAACSLLFKCRRVTVVCSYVVPSADISEIPAVDLLPICGYSAEDLVFYT